MATWVIILRKRPDDAKSRLKPVLDRGARQALAAELFQHALNVVLEVAPANQVTVLSPLKPDLPDRVTWIRDQSTDLNANISQAIRQVASSGASRVLVLPSDLPLLSTSDLDSILRDQERHDVTIVPDDSEEGTNALLVPAPCPFKPCFGVGSFKKHIGITRGLGLSLRVPTSPGIEFDLDDCDDWLRYSSLLKPRPATVTS